VFIYSCFEDRSVKSRLEKIKEITKNNANKESYIDSNCIICLEEFNKEDLDELKEKKLKCEKNDNSKKDKKENQETENIIIEDNSNVNSYNSNTNDNNCNSINDDLINLDNIINENNKREGLKERNISSDSSSKKNENNIPAAETGQKEKSFIAKLNCGHIFHSECISNWMTKKNSCPLCKKDLDDPNPSNSNNSENKENRDNTTTNTNNNSNTFSNTSMTFSNRMAFAQTLIDIQSVFYPRFSSYRMNYSNDTFSYESIPSGGSSTLTDFVKSSGGSSSSW